jgi:hypothetical protein
MDYNLYFNPNSTPDDGVILNNTYTLTAVKNLGVEMHSLGTNPLLVNPNIYNYGLQSASLAIDAGTVVGLPFVGKAPDIGAFEFTSCNIAQPVIKNIP